MYFSTEQDPNYTVKGSRDPLGFQVIWQGVGRQLIPYLSTVSSSIIDFQILCIAYALKKQLNIKEEEFEFFFIRLEQLMAYTRFQKNKKETFNGIDKVRKVMSADPANIKISNSTAEQILSNQKAYGIWGKYIRPFIDMKIKDSFEFKEIFENKINANMDFLKIAKVLNKKTTSETTFIHKDKLESFYPLLDKPKGSEKDFFTKKLLQDKCGNELLKIFTSNPVIKKMEFYDLMDKLVEESNNLNFKWILKHIKNTEKVISPLNHIFRYLQTKSFWKLHELENDKFIKNWRLVPNTDGFDETSKSLASLFQLSNVGLVNGLIHRNKIVCDRRDSASWLRLSASGIEVNHFEGGFLSEKYQPEHDNDFNYFFSTFISLHNQLN